MVCLAEVVQQHQRLLGRILLSLTKVVSRLRWATKISRAHLKNPVKNVHDENFPSFTVGLIGLREDTNHLNNM
jgi:hypothetical protein